MIKTREDSRIEVWSDQYINNPTHRKDEDRDMVIIQMEYVESGNFIVEIIPKNNNYTNGSSQRNNLQY